MKVNVLGFFTVTATVSLVLTACSSGNEALPAEIPMPPTFEHEADLGMGQESLFDGEADTFEKILARMEPGRVITNDPWDPWNNLAGSWTEIFADESRSSLANPYTADYIERAIWEKAPDSTAGTIGLVDPMSFCVDVESNCETSNNPHGDGSLPSGHGQRMAKNAVHAYPEVGVQALMTDAWFTPLLGEVDGRYQNMAAQIGVENLSNPILYAVSAFAMEPSDRAKIVAKATNERWEFNDTDGLWNGYPFGDLPESRAIAEAQGPATLAGYEWLLKGQEVVQVETEKYGTWSVKRTSYDWAKWWQENQDSLNTLIVSSNANHFGLESGELLDCMSADGLAPDMEQLCGNTDTAMAVTGVGMDTVIFVCRYNDDYESVTGNHTGPFLENTIYASGAVYGDVRSCSQATPVVAAAAQQVADANHSLSAAQIKQVLMGSADRKRVERQVHRNRSASETVRVLNVAKAVACARTLDCLE